MEYKYIIYQPGKVARLILNRPQYLNAMCWTMREEMADAFSRAEADNDVGVIVLSGAGDSFCSGNDLGTPEQIAERDARAKYMDAEAQAKMLHEINLGYTLRWRNLPKPTIAMVHSYCVGGGMNLATAMDLIFAAEDAMLQPLHSFYFTQPWDLGHRKAKEILFEHRFITAWEAFEYGLVNRVFPREKLEEETLAYAERVADNALRLGAYVRMVKQSVNHTMDTMGFPQAIEAAYQSYALMMGRRGGRPAPQPEQGGLAGTRLARRNLELSRPWVELITKR